MEAKETDSRTYTDTMLAQDAEYFKYIFKKTEKVVCAVFFITRSTKDIATSDSVVRDLEAAGQRLLDTALRTLDASFISRKRDLENVQYLLIELESKLRLLHSAQLLPLGHLEVFLQEIDAVQRALRRYVLQGVENPFSQVSMTPHMGIPPKRRTPGSGATDRLTLGGAPKAEKSQGGNRRERILTILKDKGEATIKDISEQITDCSEKTIQRELMSLIKDGIIVREGERRWSKYRPL